MERLSFRRLALFGGLSLLSAPATVAAAVVEGTVTDAGKDPVAGAMVSARDDAHGYDETVDSAAAGHFRLATTQQGYLVLRVRKLSFADASRPLRLVTSSAMTV